MNCFKTFISFATAAATACMASLMFVSCEDDFRDDSLFIPEGIGTISLQMEFTPMSEGLTGSRAAESNAKGDALNGIVDMCVLFYDKGGNLLDDYIYYYNKEQAQKPVDLPDSHFFYGVDRFKDVPRDPSDASNGKLAQDKSMSGRFDVIKIPYGQYYIVGVANLGNAKSDKYSEATTTYHELFVDAERKEAVKTIDGLRGLRLEWDASCLANNAEMFGCFTTDQTSREASSFFSGADLPSVVVNRDGMQLKSWLRRAASKLTIAFDGSDLRDNIWIHLKSAAIKDIPAGCDLGRKSCVTKTDSLLSRPAEEHQVGQYLDYTRGLPAADGGKYNTGWYTIVKGRKFPSKDNGSLAEDDENLRDPHTPDELSLFFYENMQGLGKDKRQYPELDGDGNPTGAVKDDDILKDDKPCGTYVEVKAFYRSRDGVVSNGDITYRFMLGKNVIDDYNAERNYHYKLTLHFNGKANDYDWHIDYNEEPGIKVPIPYYYVPYMYNQSMVYPVTIIGELEGDLEAEIIRSDWGPSTLDNPGEIVAGLEYYSDTAKVVGNGPWHGFLSLRMAPLEPGTDRGRKASVGKVSGIAKEYKYNQSLSDGQYNGIPYNKAYWIGEGDPSLNEKVNHRGHRFYNVTKTPVSGRSDNANDDFANDGAYEVSTTTVNGVKHTTFHIPLYSREINLIKTAGYRGNNPYMGYYRYAEIKFTATVDGKKQSIVAKVLQVPRIVNPKGIYRSWNCTDPFNVHLMRLDSEDDVDGMSYVPVISTGGPWSAEIEYITDGGGWLSVGGKTAKGDRIEGYTDSEIQFDVKFLSKCANKEAVRCAIIKVLYHNYTCTHRIMVRQGYAPVAMATGSNTKWHTFNLQYAIKNGDGSFLGHEYEYPRGEGSIFKCGNLLEAIASVNNKRDARYKSYPDGQSAYYLAPYDLSPDKADKPMAKWEDIKSDIPAVFKGVTLDVNGKTCRVPKYEDFENLRKECDFGAGVLYGDGATQTQTDVVKACGYATYLDMSERQSYGMRGWFVYNVGKDGLNLFFPIGVSGNGHRKDGSRKSGMNHIYEPGNARGVLRYAARAARMPDGAGNFAEYRPLLYTMYTQCGATYWVSGDGEEVGTTSGTTAWDINYTTFDFNTYSNDATALFGDSDAAFIRLVED